MQFIAKVVAIYSIKKTGFVSKNNHRGDKLAYFRLENS